LSSIEVAGQSGSRGKPDSSHEPTVGWRVFMSKSLRGQCLVAAKSLRDPNFYKSVVLLLEHNEQGATGLVINRPSSICVAHALSGHFNLPDTDDVVFMGGPVEPTALLMLHDAEAFSCSESSPTPGVFVGGSAETFEQVLLTATDEEPHTHFRIFSGYSGWGEGQLETEIDRGDWLVHPGCRELVFLIDPYEVYDLILQRVFEASAVLPYRVKDASLN
jgi:putative transcriptional regulator